MSLPPPRHDAAFGAAVRARRAEMGITLEQLAEATGISRSALSRIERGALGTSLSYGLAIAQALGCELSQLLHTPTTAHITRAAQTPRYCDPGTGVQRLALARPSPGTQWVLYILPEGACSSDFAAHAGGTRETFHVIEGCVRIRMGQESWTLECGDTATWRADVPHSFCNAGNGTARLMLMIASPRGI